MMNSFVPSVKSSTHDITEIMRLARLLWPEYVAPLDRTNGCDDPSLKALVWQALHSLRRDTALSNEHCHDSNCSFCQCLASGANGVASAMDLNVLKQRLSEKLDRNIRDNMRRLLSSTVMMPGRVLHKQNIEPYAKRLPYTTKFLLLAAFLARCQSLHKKEHWKVQKKAHQKLRRGIGLCLFVQEIGAKTTSISTQKVIFCILFYNWPIWTTFYEL